eukprot:Rhum_TRINITY_DN4509_c0_g1::Rhum_TRINITY_DN4509_c0_g1_i1::g.14653::m.14653
MGRSGVREGGGGRAHHLSLRPLSHARRRRRRGRQAWVRVVGQLRGAGDVRVHEVRVRLRDALVGVAVGEAGSGGVAALPLVLAQGLHTVARPRSLGVEGLELRGTLGGLVRLVHGTHGGGPAGLCVRRVLQLKVQGVDDAAVLQRKRHPLVVRDEPVAVRVRRLEQVGAAQRRELDPALDQRLAHVCVAAAPLVRRVHRVEHVPQLLGQRRRRAGVLRRAACSLAGGRQPSGALVRCGDGPGCVRVPHAVGLEAEELRTVAQLGGAAQVDPRARGCVAYLHRLRPEGDVGVACRAAGACARVVDAFNGVDELIEAGAQREGDQFVFLVAVDIRRDGNRKGHDALTADQ